MKTLMTIILIFLFILFLVASFLYLACSSKDNKLYCRIFLGKEWKLWGKVIQELKKCETFESYIFKDYPIISSYITNIVIDGIEYKVVFWLYSNRVSVHIGDDLCVLSSFDTYHSKIAANIFCEKLL